ncbi:MAG: hypothetical protein DRQ88_05410 [Epsilonproteobacteria bacterium]|nr:MAG: hypothetical protein DRQ89_08425 [Campylobacterota bacterium]RLA66754.1 MAG: hypothetical protein DRQ88_05410 [Campylobacterota bacterium]
MWKKLAITSLLLWVISISYIGYRVMYGTAEVVDKRTQITLNGEDRELVLGEMRLLLKGLKGILGGLADNDFKKVQKSASGIGMVMAVDINPSLMSKLPMSFKTMGMGVHEAFDQLASEVYQMNEKQVLKRVDKIMSSCLACHETYKIIEEN